ncbi:hypothetical protein GH733_008292 [Mirounga leonina]|nr:hypothetical protein GH733_008292 [Mirounga leonina]
MAPGVIHSWSLGCIRRARVGSVGTHLGCWKVARTQLLRPKAQELSRVPCQPQWDPSPGDAIQDMHHILMATACQDANYGTLLRELCLTRFKVSMEAIGKTLWCDWGKTIG